MAMLMGTSTMTVQRAWSITPTQKTTGITATAWAAPDDATSQENETAGQSEDITASKVVNADCTGGDGWLKDGANASASYNVNNSALNSDDYSGIGIEFWTGGATQDADLIYQDITDLPNGVYTITAVAMGRNQGGGDVCADGLYLFANDGRAQVTTNVWGTVTATGIVTDGTLRIGLQAAADNGNNWVAISNVKLTSVGSDVTAYAIALTAKEAEATALATKLEGKVPTAYTDALTEAASGSPATAEEYVAAINAIEVNIEEAQAKVKPFADAFLDTKEYAEAVLAAFAAAEDAKTTLQSAISTATATALASDDETVWTAQATALTEAWKTYYAASTGMNEGVTNFDVTPQMVVNPGFEDETPINGWTGLSDADIYANEDGTEHMVRKGGRNWRVAQTMAVPNGVYSMSVQIGFAQSDRNQVFLESSYQKQTYLFKWTGAMDDADILASWAANKEAQRSSVGNVLVIDGQITMGVEWIKDAETLKFDNFRLTYVNDGATEIKALYDALKAEADAIKDELTGTFATQLNEALAKPVTTTAEYYTAYNALNEAMAVCAPAFELQTSLAALLPECQAYVDNSRVADETARTALCDAISAAEGYEDLTTVEALQECYNTLETARQTYARIATPTGDQQFDMTFLLNTPDVTGLPKAAVSSFGWVSCTNSWSNNFANNGDPSLFYESYQNSEFAAGTWVLYQTVQIPAGSYEMTLKAFGTRANIGDRNKLAASIYAGDIKGEAIADGRTLDNVYKVAFLVTSNEGESVQLGIKTEEGNDANWVGCNDMKLYKLAPVAVDLTLNETQAYSVTADTYANVTLTRSLKANGKWNTFCVPFDMTAEQLTDNGISEVRRFSGVSASGNSVILTAETVSDGVKAGVPYIVQVSSDVSEIKVDDVTVQAAAPTAQNIGYADVAGQVAIMGNYSATTVPQGAYFISDNVFYVADAEANVTLNGFRAYITATGGNAPSQVNRLLIDIDGEVTAIEDVLGESAADSAKVVDVYTLSGVKVKSGVKKSEALDGLQRGIYIVDGQKMTK